jgi:hypothetical protein
MALIQSKFIYTSSLFSIVGYMNTMTNSVISDTFAGPLSQSINDVYSSSNLTRLTQSSGTVILQIIGNSTTPPNSGWHTLRVGELELTRTAATYTTNTSAKRGQWKWTNQIVGSIASGEDYEVAFYDSAAVPSSVNYFKRDLIEVQNTVINSAGDSVVTTNFGRDIQNVTDIHLTTADKVYWFTDVETDNSTQANQITYSTKTINSINCVVSGGANDEVVKTVTPSGTGFYEARIIYSHSSSAADTGIAYSNIQKMFVLRGTVSSTTETTVPLATQPDWGRNITASIDSDDINTNASVVIERSLPAIGSSSKYVKVRATLSDDSAHASTLNNRYATFTTSNCTVWNAANTSQNPTDIENGSQFVIRATSTGSYSCSAVFTHPKYSGSGNVTKTITLEGRADSTDAVGTGTGLQIFKENETLYPRLDTNDSQAFFHSFYTGNIYENSVVNISVPSLDVGSGWGIAIFPSFEEITTEQTSVGNIRLTRGSDVYSNPIVYELRVFRLDS